MAAAPALGPVACISLEPWDTTWRRNQHFASRLVRRGHASRLVFVEPPVLGRRPRRWSPEPGVTVVRPPLMVPKRAGGLALTGALLRATVLRSARVVWVNDPTLGVHCVRRGSRAVYDVTDDWRTFKQPGYITERLVAAEDALARRAETVVCSQVLADRWHQRYGVQPPVVQNAVDAEAYLHATPRRPDGAGPHLAYVGTLHEQRLDVELVLALADSALGTVHLVGPDSLGAASRARLEAHPGVRLHGPVPTQDVPGWMTGMDVLLCPHRVDDFTLSLDAIKAHEYLASGRPVVATPTSGFQQLTAEGLTVVPAEEFADAARRAVGTGPFQRDVTTWDDRTDEFAVALGLSL